MEKILSNELYRFFLILGIGVLSLSALLAKSVGNARERFAPHLKSTICYLVLSLLFFALAATAEWIFPKFIKDLSLFILFQVYFLLLGAVHIRLMHHYLLWNSENKLFWAEVLFTIIVGMFGCMVFVAVYRQFNKEGLELMMASSILLFVLPLLFYETFTRAISIPPRIIKHWFYPVKQQIAEPDESKLKNLMVISFIIQKHTGDTLFTNFRAKAPADMDFGHLFYYFINDYDERHPDDKIQVMNDKGEAYGWIFYKKPRWYTIKTKYVDFNNTIYLNRIKENDVIICSRSLL